MNRLSKKGVAIGMKTIVNMIVSLVFIIATIMVYRYIVIADVSTSFPVSFPFFENHKTDVKYKKISEPETLTFQKTGDVLRIDNSDRIDVSQVDIYCPQDAIKGDVKAMSILLDPSHGGSDQGDVKGEITEKELVRKLAGIFFTANSDKFGKVGFTRDLAKDIDDEIGVADRLLKAADHDLVIGFGAGYDIDSNENTIIAYISKASEKKSESKKLACEILRSMTAKKDVSKMITAASVAEIDPKYIDKDDPRQLLNNQKISVYLEIGNLNSDDGAKIFDVIDSSSIYKGIANAFDTGGDGKVEGVAADAS